MPIEVEVEGTVFEFPDDTPQDVIASAIRRHYDGNVAPVASHLGGPSGPTRDWGDTATDLLPTAGATAGAILGMPLAPVTGGVAPIALAGLAGAGGQAAKRLIEGLRGRRNLAEDTPLSAARDVLGEGAIQAGTQVVGGMIGKGASRGGRAIYRGLLKPSKAIRDSFGGNDVADTLIREGASISSHGVDKVSKALGRSRASAMARVASADPTSTFVEPVEIIREFAPVVQTLRQRVMTGQASELPSVGARGRRLVHALTTRGVGALEAQALKETAQDSASGAYRAIERGAAKQLGADDLLDKAVATGFRKAVESRVPGVAAQNRTTQALLGGTRALEDAVQRSANNLAVGGMRDMIAIGAGGLGGYGATGDEKGAAGGALLMRLLASPRGGSMAAIGLDRAGKLTPIGLRLLRELMSSHESQP